MDPSELPTQIVPDDNHAPPAPVNEVSKEPNKVDNSNINELGGGSEKKKKKKSSNTKKNLVGNNRPERDGDDSMEDSDASRDPEAVRQLAVLEKLQEELLDLQKTSSDEFDLDSGDDDDNGRYLPPSNQQAQSEYENARVR